MKVWRKNYDSSNRTGAIRSCCQKPSVLPAFPWQRKRIASHPHRNQDNLPQISCMLCSTALWTQQQDSPKNHRKYRDLQFAHVKESADIEIPGLLPADVKSMDGKLSGHKLTRMQYFELNTLADHPLLKAIVSKRICDVKKISNAVFLEYMQDYDKLVGQLMEMLDGTDEDVIFATVALFTLEWKYNVELFYVCAVNAEKTRTKEVPLQRLSTLCAELSMPLPPYCTQILHTESRFILHRTKLVPALYSSSESDWGEVQDKLWHYLSANYYITTEIVRKWDMPEFFVRYTTRAQWAQFFREHYNLRKLYTPKEWNNSRIRYVRKIYSVMIKDMEAPKT